MIDTIYAPVMIPTLNRYEHFKRCLESLEKCTDADKTVVYVGLDYPPSDKYIEGWQKIDSFLAEKEICNGFKSLIVFRREHNCGVGKEGSNPQLLTNEIRKTHDRYIFTEDDNEFSPNFLQYMNWGLSEFKDNPNVYAICGFKEVPIEIESNNVFAHTRFNAWGFGSWFDRHEKAQKFRHKDNLLKHVNALPITTIFNSEELLHAFHVLRMVNRNVLYGDTMRGCIPKQERMCIFPLINKVKNHGLDGSGQHGKGSIDMIKKNKSLQLDTQSIFDPVIRDSLNQKSIEKAYHDYYKIDIVKHAKLAVAFLLWKITKKNIC